MLLSDLYPVFRKVCLETQHLPGVDVRVMGIFEGLLQFFQLVAREYRPATHPPRVVKIVTQGFQLINFNARFSSVSLKFWLCVSVHDNVRVSSTKGNSYLWRRFFFFFLLKPPIPSDTEKSFVLSSCPATEKNVYLMTVCTYLLSRGKSPNK